MLRACIGDKCQSCSWGPGFARKVAKVENRHVAGDLSTQQEAKELKQVPSHEHQKLVPHASDSRWSKILSNITQLGPFRS